MTCGAHRLLFDYYRKKPREPCPVRLPRFFFKMAEICVTPTKPLPCRAFRLDGLITPTLKAAGSNPVGRTILTQRYRCVWRKARRINRFRAFWGPDFFFQTIDANRCFRASAPIRTGRFPFSGRCIQPVPFLNGDFSGWQRYFSQKNSQRLGRRFVGPDGLRKRRPFSFQKGRWSQRLHL